MAKKVYEEVRMRDVYRCRACGFPLVGGNTGGKVEVHHIIFRSQGGRDVHENLISLCSSCHRKAHGTERPRIERFELELLLQTHRYNLAGLRADLKKDRASHERGFERVHVCLSCDKRTEQMVCTVWDVLVAPNVTCESWCLRQPKFSGILHTKQ
jgi:hypothetical protein